MVRMQTEVAGVFSAFDFLSSHSYPAAKIGSNFFVEFDQALPGLMYYRNETALLGSYDPKLLNLPVMITETGWTTQQGCKPSVQDEATYMVQAYSSVWMKDSNVIGVMPFELMDASWEQQGFSWVLVNGQQQLPEFVQVRQLRCSSGFGGGGC